MNIRDKRTQILLAVVGFILLGWVFYFNVLRFHITHTTPDNKSYPNSIATIDVYFNKNIDTEDIKARVTTDVKDVVTVDFASNVRVGVHDKYLTLSFSTTPADGSHEITLNNIKSTSGDSLSKVIPLVIKDISYDQMNAEQKKRFDELARFSGDDEEEEVSHPILRALPYETTNYLISYDTPARDKPVKVVVTMKFFEPGNNAVPATPAERAQYLADIRTYRTEALQWIQTQVKSLDEISLEYNEPDLRSEFPAGAPQ